MSKLAVALNGKTVELSLEWVPQDGNQLVVEVDGQKVPVIFSEVGNGWDELEWLIVDGRPLEFSFDDCLSWIRINSDTFPIEIRDLEAVESWPSVGDGRITAPIPGLITAVLVEEGQRVRAGQPLMVLEAMKMENEIRSPMTGLVESIHVSPGSSVAKQALLVNIIG
jgi:acetyl/propionyl-CoA carboxylase alpha subunit